MSNLNSKQTKGNSIVLSQFAQYSITNNSDTIKGGIGGNAGDSGTDFIGEYINQ